MGTERGFGSTMSGGRAHNAIFDECNAIGLNASHCDLRGSTFNNGIFDQSTFAHSNLAGTQWDGAQIAGTDFRGANLDGATRDGKPFTAATVAELGGIANPADVAQARATSLGMNFTNQGVSFDQPMIDRPILTSLGSNPEQTASADPGGKSPMGMQQFPWSDHDHATPLAKPDVPNVLAEVNPDKAAGGKGGVGQA